MKDVIIWGNHSNTQYPDASHAKVNKGGKLLEAPAAVGDDAWLKGEFLSASFSLLCASLNLVLPIFNVFKFVQMCGLTDWNCTIVHSFNEERSSWYAALNEYGSPYRHCVEGSHMLEFLWWVSLPGNLPLLTAH